MLETQLWPFYRDIEETVQVKLTPEHDFRDAAKIESFLVARQDAGASRRKQFRRRFDLTCECGKRVA